MLHGTPGGDRSRMETRVPSEWPRAATVSSASRHPSEFLQELVGDGEEASL